MKRLFRPLALLVLLSLAGTVVWLNVRPQESAPSFSLTLNRVPPADPLTPYVQRNAQWNAADLDAFLLNLSDQRRLNVKKALDLLPAEATSADLTTKDGDIDEIKEDLVWESSHLFTYLFKDTDTVDYHPIVQWVAGEYAIDRSVINTASTFELERQIMEKVFSSLWDSLSTEQRSELLRDINPQQSWDQALLAASGPLALTMLSSTVYFSGFAFYTTMSVTINAVAGFFGLTLPFGVYAGASTLVSFLTGPIGWVLIAVGAISILGSADEAETAAAIIQMHLIKVDVLMANVQRYAQVFAK